MDKGKTATEGKPGTGRRTSLRKVERKLRFLLELGSIIGLDLRIEEILVRIAEKAAEFTESERFSILLHDPATNELWSRIPTPEGEKVLRTPSDLGIAGYSFTTGKTVRVRDAGKDTRFYRNIDVLTGHRTKSLLSMPFYGRSGHPLGVIELINKKHGFFTAEDEAFLKTFSNHIKVFIEMAQLQKARLDALREAREELEHLSRAKSKALDHLSHELKTPLALMQGVTKLLTRRAERDGNLAAIEPLLDILQRNLSRLLGTEAQAEKIVRTQHEAEGMFLLREFDRLWSHLSRVVDVPPEVKQRIAELHTWLAGHVPHGTSRLTHILLSPFIEERVSHARQQAPHRDLTFFTECEDGLYLVTDPFMLSDIVDSLLKNAAENTPDEGRIRISAEKTPDQLVIRVEDFGVGITEENRAHVFDGLFHTQEDVDYGSKKPYDFNAGGKGLELLLMKIYGQVFGFRMSVESRRCVYIPSDKDLCPGRISLCTHCETVDTCLNSGGSLFSVFFPLASQYMLQYAPSPVDVQEGTTEKA